MRKLEQYAEQLLNAENNYRDIEVEYNQIHSEYNDQNLQVQESKARSMHWNRELQFKNNQINDLKTQGSK